MTIEVEQAGMFVSVNRVASWPVVATATGQLYNMYQSTKEKNSLIKYTLETAETGVKTVANTALPVVNKLEKPICTVDSFVNGQLEKVEQKYPVVVKPTDELVKDTQGMYDANLKPTIDRILAMKQYGVDTAVSTKQYGLDTYNSTKNYTVEKYNSTKQYGVETYNSTKSYTVDKYNSTKQYSKEKVVDAKNYTLEKVDHLRSYSLTKLNEAMETPTGKEWTTEVGKFLAMTEQYVDYYLPAEEEDMEVEGEKEADTSVPADVKPAQTTLLQVDKVCTKTHKRMYNHAMKRLQNLKVRSKEALDNMNFTVNLMDYAKNHIDSVQGNLQYGKDKVCFLWEEINKTEEDADQCEEPAEAESGDKTVSNVTLERRLIATARHMTLRVRKLLNTTHEMLPTVPDHMKEKINDAQKYAGDLVQNYAIVKSLNDVSEKLVTETKVKLEFIRESLASMSGYLSSYYGTSWGAIKFPEMPEVETNGEDQDGVPRSPEKEEVPQSTEQEQMAQSAE